MKFFFLPGLLCVLAWPVAAQQGAEQPAVTVQNTHGPADYAAANLRALGAMGAFYEKLRTASGYSGHIHATKTIAKHGQIVATKELDIQSRIVGDGDGHTVKRSELVTYTATTGQGAEASTETDAYMETNNGQLSYRASLPKKIWSQEPVDKQEVPTSMSIAALVFVLTSTLIQNGAEFQAPVLQENETLRSMVTADGNTEAIYDARSGLLESIKFRSDDQTTEVVWSNVTLNKPPDSTLFQWTAPTDYQQAPPEGTKSTIQF